MTGRILWAIIGAACCALPASAAPVPYKINQHYATVGFATTGLATAQGYFTHFSGVVALDFAAPQNSRVDVTVDDSAIILSLPFGVPILRSPAYFDTHDFPKITFHSVTVDVRDATHFDVLGMLTMRGMSLPLDMHAVLESSPRNGIADFLVTGSINRTAFGMVSDRDVLGDMVSLQIHAQVVLAK